MAGRVVIDSGDKRVKSCSVHPILHRKVRRWSSIASVCKCIIFLFSLDTQWGLTVVNGNCAVSLSISEDEEEPCVTDCSILANGGGSALARRLAEYSLFDVVWVKVIECLCRKLKIG